MPKTTPSQRKRRQKSLASMHNNHPTKSYQSLVGAANALSQRNEQALINSVMLFSKGLKEALERTETALTNAAHTLANAYTAAQEKIKLDSK